MKNFVQEGVTLTLTAPAAVSSGDGVLVGVIFGVANHDAESGADVEVTTKGVYTLTKVTGTAFTQGAALYWDNGNSRLTTTASGNTLVGAAAVAAGSSDTTCQCRLN